MIVNKYSNGGGGSSSGVTPQEVQQQINSALTPYWDSAVTESAITEAVSGLASEEYVQEALSGVNLDGYYTSAQTEEAITSKNYITSAYTGFATSADVQTLSGSVVTLAGNIPDLSNYWNSAQTQSAITAVEDHLNDVEEVTASALTELHTGLLEVSARTPNMSAYTPTTGFSTINGSAITNGGNLVVQGGGDMSAYYTSAQTEQAITSKNYVTSAQVETQITDKNYITTAYTGFTPVSDFSTLSGVVQQQQIVFSSGYNELHTQVLELSGNTPVMSAYTPTTGFSTINGSAITNGGNIVIQGGGGGGISQADLASSGYLYFYFDSTLGYQDNLDIVTDYLKGDDKFLYYYYDDDLQDYRTNLNSDLYDFLKANDEDGYSDIPPQLVDYDADEDGNMAQTYGHPDFPKHLMTIYQSDYDDLVNDGNADPNTFYIVVPDPV